MNKLRHSSWWFSRARGPAVWLLGVLLVGACQLGGGTSTAGPTELKIIHNWGTSDNQKGPVMASFITDFQKANPDVKVSPEVSTDTDIPTKVESAYLAGQEPDLVFQNASVQTLGWVNKGVVVPIDSYLKSWGMTDTFLPAALSQFTTDQGKIGAFPLEGYAWPIWYNKAIFDKAGVQIPTTSDQLLAVIPKIKAAGYEVLAAPGAKGPGRALYQLILQSVITDDEAKQLYGKGGYSANAHAREGTQLFIQYRDAGLFAKDSPGLTPDTANQLFFSGKAAMLHGGTWDMASLPKDMQANVVVGGFPPPTDSPHSKPVYYAGYLGKGVWVTRNGAKKQDAVRKFIQYLYRPEVMENFIEQGAMVPPVKNPKFDSGKLNPLFVQAISLKGKAENVIPFDLLMPDFVWPAMLNVTKEAYIPRKLSVDDMLKKLDQVYQR